MIDPVSLSTSMAIQATTLWAGAEVFTYDLTNGGMRNDLRSRPAGGVVIHTPGRTFVNSTIARAEDAGVPIENDFDLDLACATRFDGNKYQGGWFIGYTGHRWKLQDNDRRTWHSASLGAGHPERHRIYQGSRWMQWAYPLNDRKYQRHGRDPRKVYDYWLEVYEPLNIRSPLEFPSGRFPNGYIGIDLRPHPQTGEFSKVQMESLRWLIRDIASELGLWPVDATTVVTHSLVDPLSRGSIKRRGKVVGVPWDPGKSWNHVAFLESL